MDKRERKKWFEWIKKNQQLDFDWLKKKEKVGLNGFF